MERQETVLLKAVRRRLANDLHVLDQLIAQARAPRLTRPGEASERIRKILDAIRAKGGSVTRQELADIVSSAGMIVTAVGALYQAGYLKADLKKGYVVLGRRAGRIGRKRA